MRVRKWSCLMIALCLLTGVLAVAFAEELQEVGSNEIADALVFEVDALEAADPEPEQAPTPNATGIALTEANFPDPSFRSYLQTECDEDGDGFLSEEEVEWNVDSLYIEDRMITSLKGIELFPALDYLNCSDNLLTSFDLSGNPNLVSLDCDDNMLTYIDLSKNTKLTYLSCENNQLTTLDVAKNARLTTLYCYNNLLTVLDLSQNIELTNLSCEDNRLTKLILPNNAKMAKLNCMMNQLTALDLTCAFHPSVQTLFAKKNIDVGDNYLKIGSNNYYVYCDPSVKVTLDGKVLYAPVLPTKVRLYPAKIAVGLKEELYLEPLLTPSNAKTRLTWKSNAPKIASVDQYGSITCLKAGTAKITVTTTNGKKATATITVKDAPNKVTLNKKGTITLKKGKTLQLLATLPKNTASSLIWMSSKPGVVAVDWTGRVTALKKGTATITVQTFNGKKASVKIKVK